MIIQKDFQVEYWSGAAWVAITTSILEVEVQDAMQGDATGLNPGTSSELSFTIKALTATTTAIAWRMVPFRLTFTTDGQTETVLGIGKSRARTTSDLTWTCAGFAELLRGKQFHSPLFVNRPIATYTSSTTIDDPANANYAGGLLNYLWWQCGGRPWAQRATYPNALFYYACDQAIATVPYNWLSGENAWDESLRQAAAAAGMITQDGNGVLTFRSQLSLYDGTPAVVIDDGGEDPSEEEDATTAITQVVVFWTPRQVAPQTELISDQSKRLLEPNVAVTISLVSQLPMVTLDMADATHLKAESITACYADGTALPTSAYTHSVAVYAQQIVVTITNTSSKPAMLHRITVKGEPLEAGEEQRLTIGSDASNIFEIPSNPLIQDDDHATQIGGLVLAMRGVSRPIRQLADIIPSGTISVLQLATVTIPEFGVTSATHQILDVQRSETDLKRDVRVMDVSGLPKRSQLFTVGTAYSASDSRLMGY